MTLEEAKRLIEATSAYPIIGMRIEDDHLFATTARTMPDGQILEFTFAISRLQLREANDPASIVAEHVKIANVELAALKDGDEPLPIWGP